MIARTPHPKVGVHPGTGRPQRTLHWPLIRQAVKAFLPTCVVTAHLPQAAADKRGADLDAILLPTSAGGIPAALERLEVAQHDAGEADPRLGI